MAAIATTAAAAAAAAFGSSAAPSAVHVSYVLDYGGGIAAIANAEQVQVWSVFGGVPELLLSCDLPGVGILRILEGSQLAVLVGNATVAGFGRDTFQLFNVRQQRLMDQRVLEADILGVELSKTRLVVALEARIHVFELPKSRHLLTIEKTPDPRGVFCFAQRGHPFVCYSCSEARQGDVAAFDLDKGSVERVITAHDTPVVALGITASGRSIATASENGKLIRVFDVASGQLQRVFRRGQQASIVFGLYFDAEARFLAVVTSRRTIHVFRLESPSEPRITDRMWRAITAEESSFATVHDQEGVDARVAFDAGRLVVITSTGWIRTYAFDAAKGGVCPLLAELRVFGPLGTGDEVGEAAAAAAALAGE